MATLFDTLVRHQIYLEGLKRHRNEGFATVLGKMDKQIRSLLAGVPYENLGDMNKTQLAKLILQLRKTMRTVFDPWLNELVVWLERYTATDLYMIAGYFDVSQEDMTAAEPEEDNKWGLGWFGALGAGVFARAMTEPMGANGLLAKVFLAGNNQYAMTKIERLIYNGYANHLTKNEIVDGLIGTKANNFRDGIGRGLDAASKATISTVMQHLNASANGAAAAGGRREGKGNFSEYEWVSVLDDNTTRICRSRDGNIYEYGKGPIPPAHVGCRSIIVPFTARVPTPDLRFNMWANEQSEDFINDAFDGKPTASYEGSKSISLAQFLGKRSLITS